MSDAPATWATDPAWPTAHAGPPPPAPLPAPPCSVGSIVFSALMFSAALVAVHGATRVPDDLFLDESEVRGARGAGRGWQTAAARPRVRCGCKRFACCASAPDPPPPPRARATVAWCPHPACRASKACWRSSPQPTTQHPRAPMPYERGCGVTHQGGAATGAHADSTAPCVAAAASARPSAALHDQRHHTAAAAGGVRVWAGGGRGRCCTTQAIRTGTCWMGTAVDRC